MSEAKALDAIWEELVKTRERCANLEQQLNEYVGFTFKAGERYGEMQQNMVKAKAAIFAVIHKMEDGLPSDALYPDEVKLWAAELRQAISDHIAP